MTRALSEAWTEAFGKLFADALEDSRMSQNEAAKVAGIKGTAWARIVKGYESKAGQRLTVNGPAPTVARMARAVGITPRQLRGVGHPHAARSLERIFDIESASSSMSGDHPSRRDRLLRIRDEVNALLSEFSEDE